MHEQYRQGQCSDISSREASINFGLGLGNSRNNGASSRQLIEGIADWYALPREEIKPGVCMVVTSARLLELTGYEGRVLNSMSHVDSPGGRESNYNYIDRQEGL